jgi:hypothetical protein
MVTLADGGTPVRSRSTVRVGPDWPAFSLVAPWGPSGSCGTLPGSARFQSGDGERAVGEFGDEDVVGVAGDALGA